MTAPAIRVSDLSKRYRLGGARVPYFTLRDSLGAALGRLAPGRHPREATDGADPGVLWALQDVSFEVAPGEIAGIIGRNGAGKTTLLKVLARITEPTRGRAELRGRVASLLEVGTGFHPELTGRENIYLSGAILGMRRWEIERRFDEIVAFAEVERFIETPIKYYSSGMHVRLGFAVAAHLEAEILFVDEVLAVGDAQFQRKCLGKIQDVAQGGRTVLFVSHNMNAVQRLCRRGIVLAGGRLVLDDAVDRAVERYLALQVRLGEHVWRDIAGAPGNSVARLLGVRARAAGGEIRSQFDVRERVGVEVEYAVLEPGHRLCVALEFLNAMGQLLMVDFDDYVRGPWADGPAAPPGVIRSTCWIPEDLLTEGDVIVNLRIFSPPDRPNDAPHVREMEVLRFAVTDGVDPAGVRGTYPHAWGKPALRPRLTWTTEHVPPAESAGAGRGLDVRPGSSDG